MLYDVVFMTAVDAPVRTVINYNHKASSRKIGIPNKPTELCLPVTETRRELRFYYCFETAASPSAAQVSLEVAISLRNDRQEPFLRG